MAPYIFCIMIPLIHNNPNGTYYNYDDRYECYKTEKKCNRKLSEYKPFLKRFQNDSRIKKDPHCKAELLKKMDVENNIENESEKSCWFFC